MAMPRVIGITGTIGAGKSAVGSILSSLGVVVYDTDKIVHQLLDEDNPVREAVIRRFGKEVVAAGGGIDREKLGQTVFNDRQARRDLEAIIHPAVVKECRRLVAEHQSEPVVAFQAPLAFEAGVESEYGEMWAVVADEKTLRERLSRRDGMTDAEISGRLAAQLSQTEKAARADHVIDNSGTLEETRRQVQSLLGT